MKSAAQLNWSNWSIVGDMVAGHAEEVVCQSEYSDTCGDPYPFISCYLRTQQGHRQVLHGDWVLRSLRGHLYAITAPAKSLQSMIDKRGPFRITME